MLVASCEKVEEFEKIEKLNYEINCTEDSTYFYYTTDFERIYLKLSPSSITIKFTENINQKFLEYLVENNTGLDSITYILGEENLSLGWLSDNISCEDTKIILLNIAKENKVYCVNPNFILMNNEFYVKSQTNELDSLIVLTDEFVVKLKNSVPASYLNSLVSETKTRIIKVTDFYYLISAGKYSTRNSLELSRLFYETEKFEYSHPNFIMNATPFKQK
jgi:hypothetical protein